MLGFKPSQKIWTRVNAAILNENTGVVVVTLISGICAILVSSGVCKDEREARAHLAAMLVSPDDGPPGSLLPKLHIELARLNDGKWIT